MTERVLEALHEIAAAPPGERARRDPRRPDASLGGRRRRPDLPRFDNCEVEQIVVERGRIRPIHSMPVEDYTNKYKGEQVEVALFGGEYQDGVLTAYCYVDDVAHIELNGHILIPLQNIASLHCSSRCDAPEPDWPPQGLAEDEPDERDDEA